MEKNPRENHHMCMLVGSYDVSQNWQERLVWFVISLGYEILWIVTPESMYMVQRNSNNIVWDIHVASKFQI